MRGIAEGRLKEVVAYKYKNIETLKGILLAERKELNPWLPIDENAPKDRPIIVYYPTMEPGLRIRVIVRSVNWDASLHKPTHYQELPQEPDDPK